MENVKKYLGAVPLMVWIALGGIILVCLFWFSDDIGGWWERRQQAKFDAKQVQYEKQINDLKKRETELIQRAEDAEAREQAKTVEADLLRQEASKRGINIEKAQQKIDAATTEYQKDQEFMDKVKAGEISKFELCQRQCKDSAEEGYPCRPNYCDPFK